MIDLNNLLKNYINQKEHHKRDKNRLWATDIYGIMMGYITPSNFFKPKKYDLTSCKNIYEGEIRELALKTLLDGSKVEYAYQTKKTLLMGDYELVAVSDFEFSDKILEIKTPVKNIEGIREHHKPQLEAQYRIFNKEIYIGYLYPHFEAHYYKYTPSDLFWKQIKKTLTDFHNKLSIIN